MLIVNDNQTRLHSEALVADADAWEDFHRGDWIPEVEPCPIDDEIQADVDRRVALAEQYNMSLADYDEWLADRRDELLADLEFSRNSAKLAARKATK